MAGSGLPTGGARYFRKYLFDDTFVEGDFPIGMVRDLPLSSIPAGAVYDATDYMFDQPGKTYMRGGAKRAWDGTGGSGGSGSMLGVAPFANTTKLILASDSKIYNITGSSSVTSLGTYAPTPICPPTFLIDKLVFTASDGTTAPSKVYISSGTTAALTALGGSPPAGVVSCAHLSYLLLANTAANPNRLFFSPIPNVESTWDTSDAYIDFDEPIVALASVAGNLLVWSLGRMWRVQGTIPPGTTGENMQVFPVANIGCIDARSVVVTPGYAIFASSAGIYQTAGALPQSLTEKKGGLGISTYWRFLIQRSSSLGYQVASAIYGGEKLIVSFVGSYFIGIGTIPVYENLVCHLPTLAWSRISLGGTGTFASATAITSFASNPQTTSFGLETLYGLSAASQYVFEFSSVFSVAFQNVNVLSAGAAIRDQLLSSAVAVQPTLTTRMIGQGPGLKAYGQSHVTYDLRDPGASAIVNSNTDGSAVGATIYVGGTYTAAAQKFTMIGTGISSIRAYLKKTGNGCNLQVTLCADNAGIPGVQVGASSSINSGSVTTSVTSIPASLPVSGLTNGASYWLVLTALNGDASNSISWEKASGGSNLYGLASGTWTTLSLGGMFQIYAGPVLTVSVLTGIEADGAGSGGQALSPTTTAQRKRFSTNTDAQAVSYLIAQTNASLKTELYTIEAEFRPYFGGDGQ